MKQTGMKFALGVLLMVVLALPAEAEHTTQEVRDQYNAVLRAEQLYLRKPAPLGGDAGQMTDEAAQSMLAYAQFMRWLAYVDAPLELDSSYAELAQSGAALLAFSDTAAHSLPQPEGFPDALYEQASRGIGGSNIASLNWMDDDVLLTAIEFFQRDEGERNRFTLGHRRWLLSPALQHTGFGLANADSGMTYVTMFVHDFSAESVGDWQHIAWPSAGAFPAEYLYAETPWCVLLNPDVYALPEGGLTISVSCASTGEAFTMDRLAQEDAPDAYWIDSQAYGLGAALIFRPFVTCEYEQNQCWHVRIDGLRRLDGSESPIEYDVRMIALEPVPVRLIELNANQLQLLPGESAALTADVVPVWADDVSIQWISSDEAVAAVDSSGCVTAIGAGSCQITAQGADGQSALCLVKVSEAPD